jgi:ribosomal protein S18 acetylase RimI-like enzyme
MKITIRELSKKDCKIISEAFSHQGWKKPREQYLNYCQEQLAGIRDIIVVWIDGVFAGYVTVVWESDYPFFQDRCIPEIVDFNVLKKFQRRGIGTILMDEAEKRIQKKSDYSGIGFGLYSDYGAAQILYIKRGYIPDGKGIYQNSNQLSYGDQIIVDDSLTLHLIKKLD